MTELNITTFEQLKITCINSGKFVYEIAEQIMAMEKDLSVQAVRNYVSKTIDVMKEAIDVGMKSQELSMSKMCGDDCYKLQQYFSSYPSFLGKCFEKILVYAIATSEENARMGKIVACPTAGSCGILPSVIIALSELYNYDNEAQINAVITAGEVGRIISNKLQLSGAVAGCQAECGVASAMSAAAVCQLRGGNINQILNAVALSIKNILGLTCDPVAGLVEVPCVKRNAFMAIHAITASELSLAGIESKIPLDEVIDAMEQTGMLMSPTLKESALAGLAETKTAKSIKKRIFG